MAEQSMTRLRRRVEIAFPTTDICGEREIMLLDCCFSIWPQGRKERSTAIGTPVKQCSVARSLNGYSGTAAVYHRSENWGNLDNSNVRAQVNPATDAMEKLVGAIKEQRTSSARTLFDSLVPVVAASQLATRLFGLVGEEVTIWKWGYIVKESPCTFIPARAERWRGEGAIFDFCDYPMALDSAEFIASDGKLKALQAKVHALENPRLKTIIRRWRRRSLEMRWNDQLQSAQLVFKVLQPK
ncbi:hypothetical protein EJ06DRAFT_518087 [Trichodelitschia bisporula]|uniref:Uncharacterized protein n=1 Tax=Trichodelitschia bisporula TaxID=703511 RepID=A0A6G1IA18_9PEZI|nr:hypothetical protein EJ06DRAFT_518087 [Trichodelitschia bisporula]